MSINLLLLCCPETLSSTSKDNCTEIQEEGMMFKGSLLGFMEEGGRWEREKKKRGIKRRG
jgi:hypothetical protein